jgi:hypothetical protein
MTSDRMRELGRKGGRKTSPAKQAACRLNAAKARAVAAAKRANGLPDFDEGEPRPAACDPPSFKPVADSPAPEPELTPPQPAVITEPAESRKLRDLNPAPKHAPAVDRPKWPPWPASPVLRTPFDHAVRMAHKTYNPHCVCSFCVP